VERCRHRNGDSVCSNLWINSTQGLSTGKGRAGPVLAAMDDSKQPFDFKGINVKRSQTRPMLVATGLSFFEK
jgi:hypothetical protein